MSYKFFATSLILLYCSLCFPRGLHPKFDSHVHLYSSKNFPDKSMTGFKVIEAMKKADIDRSFVLSSGYQFKEYEKAKFENDPPGVQKKADAIRQCGR